MKLTLIVLAFAIISTFISINNSITQKLQRGSQVRFQALQEEVEVFEDKYHLNLDVLFSNHEDCSMPVIEYRLRMTTAGNLPTHEFTNIKLDIGLVLFDLLLADELLKKSPELRNNVQELKKELSRENPISTIRATDRYAEILLSLGEGKK